MNYSGYSGAQANMVQGIEKFINDKFVKSFIPDQILKSLELLIAFFKEAKHSVFIDGKILSLTIWNIVRWWKFIKLSRKFINDLYETWK